MNNEEIEQVKEMKCLGVIIDEKLNYGKHVDYICKKASIKLNMLYRMK